MMPAPEIANFAPEMREDWLLWASGRLAIQFRDLGMACLGNPLSDDQCGFIADEPAALTPVCAWHSWLVAMAHRGALEIRQLEMLDQNRGAAPAEITEISSVALLAGCIDPRGAGRRLSRELRAISQRFVAACAAEGSRAQFVFGDSVQARSPVTKQSGVPFAACRIRAEGLIPRAVHEHLRTAIRPQGNTPTGEVLVMSNLWLDPA